MMSHRVSGLPHLFRQAYDRGFASHQEVQLPLSTFSLSIRAVIHNHFGAHPTAAEVSRFFVAFHLKDLYLAIACAAGSEAAWVRFCELYKSSIFRLALYCLSHADRAQELSDHILAELYFPDRKGRSRIANYDGRVALSAWLDAMVRYRAINEIVRKYDRTEPLDGIDDIVDHNFEERINAEIRAHRYEAGIKEAFQIAIHSLTTQERTLIRLRFSNQVPLAEIAAGQNLSISAVSRRVITVCRKIRDQVLMILTSRYRLSKAAVAECVEEILMGCAYSVLELLE